MTPRSDRPEESRRYGLGFHLHGAGDAARLEGNDAGGVHHEPPRAGESLTIAGFGAVAAAKINGTLSHHRAAALSPARDWSARNDATDPDKSRCASIRAHEWPRPPGTAPCRSR